MTQSLDSISTGSGAGDLTISHTCTGSNLVLFLLMAYDTTASGFINPTATYNGVAMTRITENTLASTRQGYAAFYLINPSTGTHNIVTTHSSGSPTTVIGSGFSFKGTTHFIEPFDSNRQAGNSGASATATVNADTNGYTIGIGGFTNVSNPSPYSISNGTVVISATINGDTGGLSIGYLNSTSTGSTSFTVNQNSSGAAFSGAFALTVANFTPLSATTGYYSLTGQNLIFGRSVMVRIAYQTYILSGQVVVFTKTKIISLTNGIYIVTGFSKNIFKKWTNRIKNIATWINQNK